MRRIALLCLCLALADCTAYQTWRTAGAASAHDQPRAEGPVMRRLAGQEPGVEPLLPEPGDIWAGILPTGPSEPPVPDTAEKPRAIARTVDRPPRASQSQPPATAIPDAAPPRQSAHAVQLVAAGSAQRAEAAWKQLQQRLPNVTRGHQPVVVAADVDGHKVWRLRADGFATAAEADAFCASVRTAKSNCWVVGP